MDKESLFSKKVWFLVMVFLVALMAAAAFALQIGNEETVVSRGEGRNDPGTSTASGLNMAVFKVDNMSCSGCISTIKGSLAGFDGIEDVYVDLASGTTEVYYRGEGDADVAGMARAITKSGYPAKTLRVLSAQEIEKQRALAASKAKYAIASVSGYDIERADFDMEMNAARKKYREDYGKDFFGTPQGKALETRLQGQILSNLIERGALIEEINRSGYSVDDGAVETELVKYIKENGDSEEALRQAVLDAGYSYEYFIKRFKNGVLINRFIEEKVLADAKTPSEKQRAFANWYKNARSEAQVAYYDRDLERTVRQRSVSGGCCPAK